MKRLRVISEGVLYKNPNPGFKAECAFLPNIVPLSDTEIICFYRLGSAFYSVDGKLAKLRSTDGGETWVQEGHVWDADNDDIPYNYSAPHGTVLKDGSMVLVAFRVDFVEPEVPMYNPETGGWRPIETVLFRSDDGGHTWSAPQLVDFPYDGTAAPPSHVIELNDGRWLLTGEHWKAWDDSPPPAYQDLLCVLRRSWKDLVRTGRAPQRFRHRENVLARPPYAAAGWARGRAPVGPGHRGIQGFRPASDGLRRGRLDVELPAIDRDHGTDQLVGGPGGWRVRSRLHPARGNESGNSGRALRGRREDLGPWQPGDGLGRGRTGVPWSGPTADVPCEPRQYRVRQAQRCQATERRDYV